MAMQGYGTSPGRKPATPASAPKRRFGSGMLGLIRSAMKRGQPNPKGK